jgi:alkylhydroperoxidase family enzyme
MLSWLIQRKIDAFERDFSYDMDYLRDVLGASVEAAMIFAKATRLGDYREDLPKDVWYSAKLVTVRAEDCGPCVQLVATMAERDEQSRDMIRAVLEDRIEDLSDEVRLSVRFTKAVLARDPAADSFRRELVERFGRRGLVSLAFAILSSRLYPTLKYALGYGHTCSVVQVGDVRVLTPQEAH